MAGDGRYALDLTATAIAEADAIGRPDLKLEALNQRQSAERLWGIGRYADTLREIERVVQTSALVPSAAEWAWAHSFYAPFGDEAAERHARDGIARTVESGRYGELSYLYICLVLVLIRRSDVRAAQAAVAEADRLGAWGVHALQEDMARILVLEYAGDLDAARGDTGGAARELLAVVGRAGAECPFEAARSRLALGQVYRRAGFKGLATETLDAAAAAFDELGIPRWARRARAEAARTGLRPAAGTLTAAERRVAELVGAGRSNRETADELFMSVKTVEANLTRIYRKLSVRSRTELANLLNRPGSPG